MCSSDLADRVEVEPFDGLLGGDDLVVAMAPAEAQQIVAQRLRQVAQVAVGVDAEGAVALRQLGPVGPVDQRNVGEGRRFPVQRLDRKSVGEGKRLSVRVDLGGRRSIKKKNESLNTYK